MLKKRGQAAVEYLLVGSLLVLIILPTIYIFYAYSHSSQEEIKQGQITKVGKDFVDVAEQIYYFGYPSKITLESSMPEGIVGIEVWKNNEIVFFLEDGSQIPFKSEVNITTNRFCNADDICKSKFTSKFYSPGLKRIVIEARQDHILIREEGDDPSDYCSPGEEKLCPNQEGVCEGSFQTCSEEGIWEGCDTSTYFDWGGGAGGDYSETEICYDELDNDCDGLTDCEDPDCLQDPHCFVCSHYNDYDSCISAASYSPIECHWCDKCSDTKTNRWGDSKCVAIDVDCSYSCDLGECGADCEQDSVIRCGITDLGECKYGEEEVYCVDCKQDHSGICVGAVYPEPEICNDGLDNDCDGLTDCEDPDCFTDPVCICAENTDSSSCTSAGCYWCPECQSYLIFNGSARCVVAEEDCEYGNCNIVTCGAECDGEGFYYYDECGTDVGICEIGTQEIHCEDCLLVGKECLGGVEPETEICNDEMDNDCDGLTDCDDPDCETDPACGPYG